MNWIELDKLMTPKQSVSQAAQAAFSALLMNNLNNFGCMVWIYAKLGRLNVRQFGKESWLISQSWNILLERSNDIIDRQTVRGQTTAFQISEGCNDCNRLLIETHKSDIIYSDLVPPIHRLMSFGKTVSCCWIQLRWFQVLELTQSQAEFLLMFFPYHA